MKKLAIVVLLIITTSAYAQIEKGDKEVSFSANVNLATEGGGGNGSVNLSTNKYLTANFSLGVSLSTFFYSGPADYTDPTAGNELKMIPYIGVFANYNFLTANAKVVPYIGVDYTLSLIEVPDFVVDISNGTVYDLTYYESLHFLGGKAGVKIFMTETVNLDLNAKYQTLLSGPEGYNAGNIAFNFGIGIILPRKQ
jgi:outer membrane protein W